MSSVIGFIYAVRCESRVKIGHSCRPISRAKDLEAWCPFPIELIGLRAGSMNDEREIHRQLKDYRTHNEWFLYHPKEVQDFLATLEKYVPKIVKLNKTTDSVARRRLLDISRSSWRSMPILSTPELNELIKGLAIPNEELLTYLENEYAIPKEDWFRDQVSQQKSNGGQ